MDAIEDEYNDTYVRVRMYQSLNLKKPDDVHIPSESRVYQFMSEIGLTHCPCRRPNGITKADREAHKSDDLLKRHFKASTPLTKCITDMTKIKAADGKLYVSVIFDCFDSAVLSLTVDTSMNASLCVHTLGNSMMAYPDLKGAILHSDRGEQYTSQQYRDTSFDEVCWKDYAVRRTA